MRIHRGFTVIEIVIVIALAALVTGFVVLSFGKVNQSEALEKNADMVVSVLNEARALTLSAAGNTKYGVHFDANQVVLFQGTSYSAAASSNVPTALNALVTIQNISLTGGGSNIVFDRLTGKTSYSGSVQIALKSAASTYKTVSVSASGVAERN